jgi:diguanylate cyclase
VLPNTASADAARIGEEIREIIEKQTKNRLGIAITVSVGVATFPKDGKSLAAIVERADQAMYQAKEAGRNRVCKYHA